MKFGAERRKYQRFPCNFPLRYRNIDERMSQISGGLIRDISEGGVRFVSQRFIPIATNLDLILNIPFSPRLLRIGSRVVWIHKASTGEYYEVGIEFTSIKEEDRRDIRKFGLSKKKG